MGLRTCIDLNKSPSIPFPGNLLNLLTNRGVDQRVSMWIWTYGHAYTNILNIYPLFYPYPRKNLQHDMTVQTYSCPTTVLIEPFMAKNVSLGAPAFSARLWTETWIYIYKRCPTVLFLQLISHYILFFTMEANRISMRNLNTPSLKGCWDVLRAY